MNRLVFDFPGERAAFKAPVETIAATTLDEVRPAIARVQQATAGGLHAAGFVSYEAAPAFEPAMRVHHPGPLPLLWFGLFDGPEEAGSGRASPGSSVPALDWRLEWSAAEHAAALAEVREAIAAGRTYQVNLTTRLRAPMRGDPWPLYEGMRRGQGGGYHAYLDLGRHVLLSASPELFFRTRGRAIETRPMKGTRPRGRWPEEDRGLEAALGSSGKDRAENLMIVDLLRNDLGRVCATGSVEVTALREIERYRTVWQMTSAIRGRLRDDVDLAHLFDALFPCGSVTGAPKISTMAEIARLESSPRGVYCGAIGWVRPGGDCTFSVPIRTAWLDREAGAIEYGTGGGVVWDSTAEGEYDELRAKAVVIREPWPDFALLETLAIRDGEAVRRDRHLARMRASADHFGFPFHARRLEAALDDLARSHPRGDFRARITLDARGEVAATAEPLGVTGSPTPPEPAADPSPLPVIVLAPDPVDSASPFLYHKTTHRETYETRRRDLPADAFDALLQNERGEVTEFTRGNLVAELDGQLWTPPRESGLLPGCLRQELLDAGAVRERVILSDELPHTTRLWFVNSARRWIEVTLKGR